MTVVGDAGVGKSRLTAEFVSSRRHRSRLRDLRRGRLRRPIRLRGKSTPSRTWPSRLADEATGGQVLIAQRLYAEIEDDVDVEPVGEVTLKRLQRPVAAFNVASVRREATERLACRQLGGG